MYYGIYNNKVSTILQWYQYSIKDVTQWYFTVSIIIKLEQYIKSLQWYQYYIKDVTQ